MYTVMYRVLYTYCIPYCILTVFVLYYDVSVLYLCYISSDSSLFCGCIRTVFVLYRTVNVLYIQAVIVLFLYFTLLYFWLCLCCVIIQRGMQRGIQQCKRTVFGLNTHAQHKDNQLATTHAKATKTHKRSRTHTTWCLQHMHEEGGDAGAAAGVILRPSMRWEPAMKHVHNSEGHKEYLRKVLHVQNRKT